MRTFLIPPLFFLLLPTYGAAREPFKPAASSLVAPKQPRSLPEASYEDTASGLKRQMQDVMEAAKEGDHSKLEAEAASMVIPGPAAWFEKVFGPVIGGIYVQHYPSGGVAASLVRNFQELAASQFTKIDVIRFTQPCADSADEYEYPLLVSRQEPAPISEVRFIKGKDKRSLRFFVYVDGAFRFTGNIPPYPNADGSGSAETVSGFLPTVTPRIGATVQQAHLIKEVPPANPSQLKEGNGEVVLHALVSVDGTTKDLKVIKGQCGLAKLAVKAVLQWKYSPMLVDGTPVEATADIYVAFSRAPD